MEKPDGVPREDRTIDFIRERSIRGKKFSGKQDGNQGKQRKRGVKARARVGKKRRNFTVTRKREGAWPPGNAFEGEVVWKESCEEGRKL